MQCPFRSIRRLRGMWILWAVLPAWLAGCGSGQRTAEPLAALTQAAGEPVPRVVVRPIERRVWPRTVRVQGSLYGDERVIVAAKVAGRIDSLGLAAGDQPIDLGTFVEAGDVLAALEPEDFALQVAEVEAQVAQVRAALGLKADEDEKALDPLKVPSVLQEKVLWDEAQAHWERAEALSRQSAISSEELQQRKAQLDVAAARYESALHRMNESVALLATRRAQLALALQQQQDAVIRAPFAGVVEQRHVAPGAYVQAGAPVVSLVRIDPLRFRAGVPEREATHLKMGQVVAVLLEGESAPLPAAVTRISPSLDLASRSLTIEADLPNPDLRLRAGLFAEAEIVVDPATAVLAVPSAAVRQFAGVDKVWIVRDGQAEERTIETGRRSGDWVEVLDGVVEGDSLVTEGSVSRAGPVEAVSSP